MGDCSFSLAANGGVIADQIKPEKGGACRCWASPGYGWSYIMKVNKGLRLRPRQLGQRRQELLAHHPLRQAPGAHDRGSGDRGPRRRPPDGRSNRERLLSEGRTCRPASPLSFVLAREGKTRPPRATGCGRRSGGRSPAAFPDALAERMIDLADLRTGHRVLEPSSGTGRLMRAVLSAARVELVGVEISPRLVEATRANSILCQTDLRCADFLSLNADDLGGLRSSRHESAVRQRGGHPARSAGMLRAPGACWWRSAPTDPASVRLSASRPASAKIFPPTPSRRQGAPISRRCGSRRADLLGLSLRLDMRFIGTLSAASWARPLWNFSALSAALLASAPTVS